MEGIHTNLQIAVSYGGFEGEEGGGYNWALAVSVDFGKGTVGQESQPCNWRDMGEGMEIEFTDQ